MIIELSPETPKPSSTPPTRNRGLHGSLVVAAALVASTSAGGAATATWNGSSEGGNSNWFDSVNWDGGSNPDATKLAVFGNASSSDVVVDEPADAFGLKFTGVLGYFFTDGNVITLHGGGLESLGNIHDLEVDLVLGNNGLWNIAAGTTTIRNEVSGGFALTKAGAGRLNFLATNSYTGGTGITGGTLAISQNDSLGEAGSGVTFGGGTLEVSGGIAAFDRPIQLDAGGGTIDVTNSFTLNLGTSVITGPGNLVKNGPGKLVLNTFKDTDGATSVNAGTLAGTGSVRNGLTLANAATLSPGDTAVGLFTVLGNASLAGTYRCDMNGGNADQLVVSGNLNLTGATLNLQNLSASTLTPRIIATYGSCTGTFATINGLPAGFTVDYNFDDGITVNHVAIVPPPITFEANQGYPVDTDLGPPNGTAADAPFDGINGWSYSLGDGPGRIVATTASGEYPGGQALAAGTVTNSNYGGAINGNIAPAGLNTLSFDVQNDGIVQVGFLADPDDDGKFDINGDTGMSFGFGDSGGTFGHFKYFRSLFSTTAFPGAPGTLGNWYRVLVTIGEVDGGNRAITMAARDLTTGSDVDFDSVTAGIQPWSFTVSAANFGVAPEDAKGIWVRITQAGAQGAKLDNLRATYVVPPYRRWALSSGLTAGVNDAPGFDANGDGTLNIQHYAFDTHPLTSDGTNEGKWLTESVMLEDKEHFALTLPVRMGATFAGSPSPSATVDGITYVIEGSGDLLTWLLSVSEVTPADSAGLPALRDIDANGTPDWEYRTFIHDDETLSYGFLRGMLEAAP